VADATDEDIVEEQPVVGGAAARDRGMISSAEEDTPASRASAALAATPRAAAPDGASSPNGSGGRSVDEDERPRRHPVRTTVLLVVLLAVLGGGVWFGWAYTQRQYYVGVTDDGVLAVFQGVPGEIAGVRLSSVQERSGTRIEDLTTVTQDTVRQGIHADNEADARRKLSELTSDDPENPHKLPLCSLSPAPGASPSATPSAPPASAGVSSTPGVTSPTPGISGGSPTVEDSMAGLPTAAPNCREN
jgi:protein phosphatase